MKNIHPLALFRLSVLGPLASRKKLERGELKSLLSDLASRHYDIPDSQRTQITEATIERWYYQYRKGGIDALAPKTRSDQNQSKLPSSIQEAILKAKKDNPSRSINAIITLLELQGLVGKGTLTRSSIYRLLKAHNLSSRVLSNPETIERRRFVAEYAGDLWQGDVMHGPSIPIKGKHRKLYLVSLMDDASRLIVHSEFRLGETALDIEAVLKQATLKRGLPNCLLLDNGPAYRSGSLQGICARLQIRIAYCRPYEAQGKGKIEKWHSLIRREFIDEVDWQQVKDLNDINGRLWAYLDQIYHARPHHGLDSKLSPIERWRQDLVKIRSLGTVATQLEEIFYHRHKRRVRKDGCVSFNSILYEVPYELSGKNVFLVFDPETNEAKWVESEKGERLGEVTALDAIKNNQRKRKRPIAEASTELVPKDRQSGNIIESAYDKFKQSVLIDPTSEEK